MRARSVFHAAVALAALRSLDATAVPVHIGNADFEAQAHGPNSFIFGAPTDWAPYNTDAVSGQSIGTLNPTGTTYFEPGQWGGNNVAIAYMDSAGTSGVAFGLQQTLGETLQAQTTYRLSVGIGNIATGSSDLGNGPVEFFLDGFPGYRVELRAGNELLAVDHNQLASGGNQIPDGEFRTSLLVFDSTGVADALIGEPLQIGLLNLNIPDPAFPGAHREVDFDDLMLDAEPSAAAAPASGLLLAWGALLPRRWPRRRRSR